MDDTCVIRRDPEGVTDDTFDEDTGELNPPDPDESTIYDADTLGDGDRALGGRCKFSPSKSAIPNRQGGLDIKVGEYNCGLPWDAPVVEIGDVVECLSSRRDPELVDKQFTVKDVVYSTFLVSRKLLLELRR